MASIFEGQATGDRQVIDEQEAHRGLAVIADSLHGCFIQGHPGARGFVLPGRDLDGLISAVKVLGDGCERIQVALNPVPVTLAGTPKVKDFLRRRWLMVGIDPILAAGVQQPCMATAAERKAALRLGLDVIDWLTPLGWPSPVVIDSGNGYHLLFRVELPNDDETKKLLSRCMKVLKAKFDGQHGQIEASASAHLATRIPGTWRRKGISTAERPHLQGALVEVPDELELVSMPALLAVAGNESAKLETPVPSVFTGRATGDDRAAAYIQRALDSEARKLLTAPEGTRHEQCNRSAFALGQLAGADLLTDDEVRAVLLPAATGCGLPEREALQAIRDGIAAGRLEPRGIPPPTNNGKHQKPAPSPAAGERIIVRADEIEPRRVEWLWPGRIPLGKLITFAGNGGLGKTFVLCDIAARVTRGLEWPDGTANIMKPSRVLYITGEDDLNDTLVPRLIESGADLAMVTFLKTEIQDRFCLRDLPTLEAAIEQSGPDMRLVAIDPPTAFLDGVDDHKNSELRGLLSPLKSWAGKRSLSVVFVTHVNKPQGKVEAIMRVMGSVAWVNAVRAAHIFAKDPEDQERRLFIGIKINVSKERKGLAYRIEPLADDRARVQWLGEVDMTADEAMSRQVNKPRAMQAAEWLAGKFSEQKEWASNEIFQMGAEEGISRNAIFEAKKTLSLPKPRKVVKPNGDECWYWWVPDNWSWSRSKKSAPDQGSEAVANEEEAF